MKFRLGTQINTAKKRWRLLSDVSNWRAETGLRNQWQEKRMACPLVRSEAEKFKQDEVRPWARNSHLQHCFSSSWGNARPALLPGDFWTWYNRISRVICDSWSPWQARRLLRSIPQRILTFCPRAWTSIYSKERSTIMHRIASKRSKLFRLRKPADRGMFFWPRHKVVMVPLQREVARWILPELRY